MNESPPVGALLSLVAMLFVGSLLGCGNSPDTAPPQAEPERSADVSAVVDQAVEGPEARKGKMAVRLTAYPGVIGRGGTVGVMATNVGKTTLGFGYGEGVERKTEQGWVGAHIYRKGVSAWSLPLLGVEPGESRGPDIEESGWMGVVVSPDAAPGLYRITKQFQDMDSNRGSNLNATVNFRISAKDLPVPTRSQLVSDSGVKRNGDLSSRLTLDAKAVEPGAEVSMTVENLGSVPLTVARTGKLFRRGTFGQWNAVRNTGVTAADTYEPEDPLTLKPGEAAGPGFDTVAGKVDLPSNLKPGSYRITTFVNRSGVPQRSHYLQISAPIRVTG